MAKKSTKKSPPRPVGVVGKAINGVDLFRQLRIDGAAYGMATDKDGVPDMEIFFKMREALSDGDKTRND